MKVARDLMVSVPAVYTDDLVTKARQILREGESRELYVRNRDEVLEGYIDITDVLRIRETKSNVTVEGFLHEAPCFHEGTSLSALASGIRDAGTDSCAVILEGHKISGAVPLSGILPLLITLEWLNGNVADFMNPVNAVCAPDDPISKVYGIIVESGHAAIPVVRGGIPVGIISRRDLLREGRLRRSWDGTHITPAESVMTTPAICVRVSDTLAKAASMMVKYNISRIPATDDRGEIMGIMDRNGVLFGLKE